METEVKGGGEWSDSAEMKNVRLCRLWHTRTAYFFQESVGILYNYCTNLLLLGTTLTQQRISVKPSLTDISSKQMKVLIRRKNLLKVWDESMNKS